MEGNGSCRACFLRKQPRGGHPLSLLTTFAASSPKGTPLRYAGNLSATTKSRPLGEGGIAVGDDGRGIPDKYTLQFNQKLSRHAKSSPFGRAGAGAPERVASNAKAARPGGLAAFMLIKIFYSTSSSAKIHSTSLMWEPLRE